MLTSSYLCAYNLIVCTKLSLKCNYFVPLALHIQIDMAQIAFNNEKLAQCQSKPSTQPSYCSVAIDIERNQIMEKSNSAGFY